MHHTSRRQELTPATEYRPWIAELAARDSGGTVCRICGGAGERAYSPSGHPNDPRVRYFTCDECGGWGWIA